MTISTLTDDIVFLPSLPENRRPKIEGDLSEDGLRVISPQTKFTGSLTVNENVGIGTSAFLEKLEVAGNIKIKGGSIKNYEGLKIIETNKSDWLRINPDQSYPGIALYKPVAIGTGGLAIGELSQLAQGQLKVTSSAYLAINNGNVGIGTTQPGEKLHIEGGNIRIRQFPSNDTTPSLTALQLFNRGKGGTNLYWSLYTAAVGGGWGVNPNAFEIWEYPATKSRFQIRSGGNTILTPMGGNVGIGTITPRGKLEVMGDIWAGNSDIYFTKTDHVHTGIGNQAGFAAIENSSDYNALMILGRAGTAHGRCVKLWDYLQVHGNVEITGKLGTNGFSSTPITRGWGGGIHTWDVEAEGTIWSRHGYQSGGRDYAEYFESLDGQEIPPGTSVVLVGNKVSPAKKDEIPFGVISAAPCVVGNVYKEWPDKYLKDVFGNPVMEEYQEEILVPQKRKVTRERQKMEKKTVSEEVTVTKVVLDNGKYCQRQFVEEIVREIEQPLFYEVDLYDATGSQVIGKHQVPIMETWEEEIDVLGADGKPVLVATGEFVTKKRQKLNPFYDESKDYTIRELRPEWNCVGLLGQLPVRKGQPVAPNWIKLEELSSEVELWLIK